MTCGKEEESEAMKTKCSPVVWIAVIAILGAAVGWIALAANDDSERKTPAEPAVVRPVPTAVVRTLAHGYERVFPGIVRASRRVKLAFSVSGLLEELNAAEGRSVRKAEVIARLDQRDYRHAFEVAKASYMHAKRELARLGRLHDEKVATQAEHENAETAYDIAAVELRIREKALTDTVLRAPFDGVIAKRYLENYEHVEARQPILSYQDISRIEVVIQMPERLLAHGAAGEFRELQVCFDADNERWFDASIGEYSAESNSITRTFDMVVTLDPPATFRVFPGMTAAVRTRIADSSDTSSSDKTMTRIPVEALWEGQDGESYVWTIDPAGGKPSKRKVETRVMHADYVEISSGLRPGEHVAIAGLHTLREDLLARPTATGKEGLDG